MSGIGAPRPLNPTANTSPTDHVPASGTPSALTVPAAPPPLPTTPPKDAAIAAAFPRGFAGASTVASGARGDAVVAIQYALGRLGHLHDVVDGRFGPKSASAVKAFQKGAGLPETGAVDPRTLVALDAAVSALPAKTPAARAANPITYLSQFEQFDLSKVEIRDRRTPVGWNHPEVREQYGRFVGEYWPVLKANAVEGDCKTVSLFFMDQFRKKVKADTGLDLSLPASAGGAVPRGTWSTFTADRPSGAMSRFSALPQVRPGYAAPQLVQKLDPKHSMIYGVNVRYAGPNANMVGNAATTVAAWDPRLENRGDRTKPEVPLDQARPGDMVYIDHTGDGTWDHAVNIVGVKRDAAGKVAQVTMAVGSFDDMKDADSATAPTFAQVNNYSEEVVVDLDPATGKIAKSQVTWSSEPDYLVGSRYSERTTIMELKPGGKLKLARWGDAPR